MVSFFLRIPGEVSFTSGMISELEETDSPVALMLFGAAGVADQSGFETGGTSLNIKQETENKAAN